MKSKILLSVKDFPKGTGTTQNYPIDQKIPSPDPSIFQLSKNLSGKVTLTKLTKLYIASFHLKTQFLLPCSRCNKPTKKEIELKFKQEYKPPDIKKDGIDILPVIFEELILLLPSKILCQESCQGLCAVCGKDLNTGKCACKQIKKSPFEKLKKLKIKK